MQCDSSWRERLLCSKKKSKGIRRSPCAVMTEELRKKMGEVAVKAAKAVNYKSTGTIEFLVDKNFDFYFMEMNTRIQVEHPITEMITGVDLIKEQIKIATGKKLELSQEDIKLNGHAIECRINAENPSKGFMPSPGTIKITHLPGGNGVRVDSAIYQGYKIPPTYDSMVAKLIVHGKNREEDINKMRRALEEFIVEGIDTNIDFQFRILSNENFVKGYYDTGLFRTTKVRCFK
jgi:acetyl-CoA carboxylase biotin carboxylase subunit